MKYKNEKIRETWTLCVQRYKASMQYAREEKSKVRRALYGITTFGIPYIPYTLARFKIPVLFGNTHATLFFGKQMTLPADDIGSYVFSLYGIIPHGCERKLTEWMMRNVDESDVVYDVGAHLGFYTALAEHLAQDGEVHAFEANKKLCTYLHKNFSTSSQVFVTCTIVAGSEEEVDFYDATDVQDSSASSRFNIVESHVIPTKLPAMTLDAYIASGRKPPTIIKLDIEGGEYDAIMGALNLIEKNKPRIILEVWGGEMGRKYSDNAVKKLQKLGYEAFSFERDGTVASEPISDPVGNIPDGTHNPRDNFLFATIGNKMV